MASEAPRGPFLTLQDNVWVARYSAMAGPCEIHLPGVIQSEAGKLASFAFTETLRIEHKFSRYRDDNIVWEINHAGGRAVKVDPETAGLLQFADQCFRLSDGLFDITSGVLRKAWQFDGREVQPDRSLISSLLGKIGWHRAVWDRESLALSPEMEIDLGGIGKEYAVDRVARMLSDVSLGPMMINFGGDIRIVGSPREPRTWVIGIENPDRENEAVGHIEIGEGAVATSGDAQRYCYFQGRRLGHILNPLTGWPVDGAPRSVTVIGGDCLEAGFLSTLAMLQGSGAEAFLKSQGVRHHCRR